MLTERGKIWLYVGVISFLSVVLYFDYTYKIPYNYGFFDIFFEFPPKESPHTWTWLFLLFAGLFLVFPLVFKQRIGILGLVFLSVVISKSFVIDEVPKQTAQEFLKEFEPELSKLIKQNQHKKTVRSSSAEIEKVGFKRLLKTKNTYYFIINFYEGHIYGICFCKEKKLPTKIGRKYIFYKKIKSNWFTFDTFSN